MHLFMDLGELRSACGWGVRTWAWGCGSCREFTRRSCVEALLTVSYIGRAGDCDTDHRQKVRMTIA